MVRLWKCRARLFWYGSAVILSVAKNLRSCGILFNISFCLADSSAACTEVRSIGMTGYFYFTAVSASSTSNVLV